LDARLQDTVGIVDAARIPLETEQHLPRGSRAVDTVLVSAQAELPIQSCRNLYNGDLRFSRPARWSLWMWLKKHASGGRSSGCERKKSTAVS